MSGIEAGIPLVQTEPGGDFWEPHAGTLAATTHRAYPNPYARALATVAACADNFARHGGERSHKILLDALDALAAAGSSDA